LVLAGLAIGRWVIKGNYYIAEYSGMVSIMRGIQGSLLGISLSEPYLVGCLNTRNDLSVISYSQSGGQLGCHVMKLQDLRPPERAQVQGVLPASSLDEAEAQLRTLSAKALLPCPPPRATSPPADTSETPSATPLPTSSTPTAATAPNGSPPGSIPANTTPMPPAATPTMSPPSTEPGGPANTGPTITAQTVTAPPPPPPQPGVDCRASA
jgi:PPM family protein phosphatase